MHGRLVALLILLAATPVVARDPRADFHVHGMFGDGMVLQRERPCPVWGHAPPGAEVRVTIAGQTKSARAGGDGRWSIKLDPMPAGGPHEMTVAGPASVTFRDVLIGEVWLASGGSNMELPLKAAKAAQTQADEEAAGRIRFFQAPKAEADDPVKEISGTWKSARSEATAEFSAVAYYFARDVQRMVRVPVGILQASENDTRIDQWIALRALHRIPGGRGTAVLYEVGKGNYQAALDKYRLSVKRAEEAKKNGQPVPEVLPEPVKSDMVADQWNARICPMIPYAIRGVIFYQGEADLSRSYAYETLLPGMIKSWRDDWGQGDFPVGFVQLANYGPRPDTSPYSLWAQFRESQRRALTVPNTGMAAAIDLGEEETTVPRNKEDVGARLALWAGARVYGKSFVDTGPLFDSMKIEGDHIRILFKNLGSGLKAEGRLRGFRISGEFRRFVDADAEINGETVLVSNPGVRWPAAVRYGWSNNPDLNLTNKEGYPAVPFRTDNW
jgi:sialate O-acetylesterase